jgi:hypothetical protein
MSTTLPGGDQAAEVWKPLLPPQVREAFLFAGRGIAEQTRQDFQNDCEQTQRIDVGGHKEGLVICRYR